MTFPLRFDFQFSVDRNQKERDCLLSRLDASTTDWIKWLYKIKLYIYKDIFLHRKLIKTSCSKTFFLFSFLFHQERIWLFHAKLSFYLHCDEKLSLLYISTNLFYETHRLVDKSIGLIVSKYLVFNFCVGWCINVVHSNSMHEPDKKV